MKTKITKYVAPDLSEYDKRLSVIEQNSQKELDYVNNIKNDLKSDIRRTSDQVDQVERSAKQTQRETQQDVQDVRKDLKQLGKDVDNKIQKALDNPLAK
jgi:peptidoglycan hydrolase CwlO-like protein